MTIYSVVRTEETWSRPCETFIDCSFKTLHEANAELVKKVIRSVETRSDMAYALYNDENHPEIRAFLIQICGKDEANALFIREDEKKRMPHAVLTAVTEYVKKEIEGTGCYYMCVENGDQEEFHFDIIKNKLEEK